MRENSNNEKQKGSKEEKRKLEKQNLTLNIKLSYFVKATTTPL